ncbi:MAG: type II 3-dehydroquinate dehydratase [Hyphomicrobiaceae bacterium]
MPGLITILNGPNLNLLGKRQPEIYGHETLDDVAAACRARAGDLGFEMAFHQSNREYEIIDWIQDARETAAGIIINPAAFTHTSLAILDALLMCECPIIEVHISDPEKRESFRHFSYVAEAASETIAGHGTKGYLMALERMPALIQSQLQKT